MSRKPSTAWVERQGLGTGAEYEWELLSNAVDGLNGRRWRISAEWGCEQPGDLATWEMSGLYCFRQPACVLDDVKFIDRVDERETGRKGAWFGMAIHRI